MENLDPAKHSPSSFTEAKSISMLNCWFSNTERVMPDLKALDRWPNIDGYIEIVDNKGVPQGKFEVQVKSLAQADLKHKKYTFKDQKFFNYCYRKQFIDNLPILFIGVDIKGKKAYWVHIDKENIKQLKSNNIVKFCSKQTIDDNSTKFIQDWKCILKQNRKMMRKYNEYRAYLVTEDAQPLLGKENKIFINFHNFLDSYNNLLSNEFNIVKKIFYPNCWKIGCAYRAYKKDSLSYLLYPIPLNKNDVQIKKLDKKLNNIIKSFGFTCHYTKNPIMKEYDKYAKAIIYKKLKKLLENKYFNHIGSDFLAREFIFAFIDFFHKELGLENKDIYIIKDIEIAFNNNCSNLYTRQELPIKPFYDFFSSMDKDKEIKRPYKLYNHTLVKNLKAYYWWEGFLKKDIQYNFKLAIKNLLEAYNMILNNNFPLLKQELSLFSRANLIIVTLATGLGRDNIVHGDPIVEWFFLKSKNTNDKPLVEPLIGKKAENFNAINSEKDLLDEIYYNKKKYKLTRHESHFAGYRFIPGKTPLLNRGYK